MDNYTKNQIITLSRSEEEHRILIQAYEKGLIEPRKITIFGFEICFVRFDDIGECYQELLENWIICENLYLVTNDSIRSIDMDETDVYGMLDNRDLWDGVFVVAQNEENAFKAVELADGEESVIFYGRDEIYGIGEWKYLYND